MSIFQMSISIPTPLQTLSSSRTISGGSSSVQVFFNGRFPHHSLTTSGDFPLKTTTIRMGGGPRTYPGGVSKWQWKRMQAKKAKQLLKARLARERQIYEMRKRAELKAAVSELERPWEVVEKAPTLFSVSTDEQLKVLADRFQKPGGLDLWSESDGPELFRPDNGMPTARFFPKGVVHSIQPYGKIEKPSHGSDIIDSLGPGSGNESDGEMGLQKKSYNRNARKLRLGLDKEGNLDDFARENFKEVSNEVNTGTFRERRFGKKGNRRKYSSDAEVSGVRENEVYSRAGERRRGNGYEQSKDSKVYNMNLQNDGSYGV
ncbi:putative DEAD-box ATP-dependent RNA helicase 48 [Forsythia ovata]|uniref:DEAD-box ATP-dependent RNA helicase 48 n=1 Tax=Forsythia ovata TaxID=205694 RepID=A0ABD1TA27_9LAMI